MTRRKTHDQLTEAERSLDALGVGDRQGMKTFGRARVLLAAWEIMAAPAAPFTMAITTKARSQLLITLGDSSAMVSIPVSRTK
jgi:hypothetical protein